MSIFGMVFGSDSCLHVRVMVAAARAILPERESEAMTPHLPGGKIETFGEANFSGGGNRGPT
jgi:hypothetical protein